MARKESTWKSGEPKDVSALKSEVVNQVAAARKFAALHSIELAREIIEWQDTALLRDGRLRELALLCSYAEHDALRVAEHIATRAVFDTAVREPQPTEQPEPSCGWAGCPHGAECVHAKQPEPGGLTDAQLLDLALKHKLPCAEDIEFRAAQGTALTYPEQKAWDALRSFTREVLATTRKRSDEEVARIMEAVDRFLVASTGGPGTYAASRSEVERLVRGERS